MLGKPWRSRLVRADLVVAAPAQQRSVVAQGRPVSLEFPFPDLISGQLVFPASCSRRPFTFN